MQIKKYLAPTLKEATAAMKIELGDEAIVLSTRIIEDDPLTGRKRMFEITAGIDDDYAIPAAKPVPSLKTTARAVEPPATSRQRQKTFAEELQELTEKVYAQRQKEAAVSGKPLPKGRAPEQKVSGSRATGKKIADPFNYEQKAPEKPHQTRNDVLNNELKEITDTLLQREVQKRTVDVIIEQLRKYSDFLQPSNIDSYVVSTISSLIPTSNFEVRKQQKAKLIALVGPTGVGKTTCIAKLAVISKILHNLEIGLISLDTYRLGAIDQLKIFSEISHIDMRVAYEASELPKLIHDFRKKDLIFIDTAGRSQNNTGLLKETKKFLAPLKVDEVYLVLSTTTTTKNMMDVAEKFKVLNYNGLVFTKLDEAVSFGNILNVANGFNVPVKYLTNGQVIPDDIIAADPQFIANMIYSGKISK